MSSPSQTFTPKQVARAIGVSESSLKRWCDRGLLSTVRTAGGHRRLTFAAVMDYLKATGRPLVRPDLLGLPATSGLGERVLDRAVQRLQTALVEGDATLCRQVLFDLHLAGHAISAIGDKVIAPAFQAIGIDWERGKVEVYQERRACEISLRALHELERLLPDGDAAVRLALGGTIEGDSYAQATTLVAMVLRQQGWQAVSLGSGLPFSTLVAAIERHRPHLFWLSVAYIADETAFIPQFNNFSAAAARHCPLALGGRALHEGLRLHLRFDAFCPRLADLEAYLRTLPSPAPAPAPAA